MIVQKIIKQVEDRYDLAFKYYSVLSVINGMELVKRDIQLLAFSISEDEPVNEVKKKFVEKFSSSMATVGNIISKLYKLNVLVKDKRVVTINPLLLLDFNKDLIMQMQFKHGDKG